MTSHWRHNGVMELDKYTQRFAADLTAAAALGDKQTRKVAEGLGGAAEASARLMLIAALSDLAAEIDGALDHHEVKLVVRDADVDVEVRPVATASPSDTEERHTPNFEELTGDISRVTLRLVETIKARAEEAAAANGQSLNSWLSQAVQGALRNQQEWRRRDWH